MIMASLTVHQLLICLMCCAVHKICYGKVPRIMCIAQCVLLPPALVCIVAAAAAAASHLQALDAASRALTGAAAVEMAPALADLVRRGDCNNSLMVVLLTTC
jgi:hypothetical protein